MGKIRWTFNELVFVVPEASRITEKLSTRPGSRYTAGVFYFLVLLERPAQPLQSSPYAGRVSGILGVAPIVNNGEGTPPS